MDKTTILHLIQKECQKPFYYECDYRIAERSDLLKTQCVVSARNASEATNKLRGNFRTHGYRLVRFKDITIR